MRGMHVILFSTWLRVMLCDDKFWPGDTFAAQLSNAFDDFQQFTRARKIPHSQKRFTPRLVSRFHLECFDCFVQLFDPCLRLISWQARFLFSWWNPDQVVKKDGSLLMTAKAYNGRCILEWLHDALLRSRSSGTFSDERVPLACMCLSFWCIYWQNSLLQYIHPKRNQNFLQTKHFIL